VNVFVTDAFLVQLTEHMLQPSESHLTFETALVLMDKEKSNFIGGAVDEPNVPFVAI